MLAADEDSLTNKFMRTIGGFLTSPRFVKQNSLTSTAAAASSQQMPSTAKGSALSVGRQSEESCTEPSASVEEGGRDSGAGETTVLQPAPSLPVADRESHTAAGIATKSFFSYFSKVNTAASAVAVQNESKVALSSTSADLLSDDCSRGNSSSHHSTQHLLQKDHSHGSFDEFVLSVLSEGEEAAAAGSAGEAKGLLLVSSGKSSECLASTEAEDSSETLTAQGDESRAVSSTRVAVLTDSASSAISRFGGMLTRFSTTNSTSDEVARKPANSSAISPMLSRIANNMSTISSNNSNSTDLLAAFHAGADSHSASSSQSSPAKSACMPSPKPQISFVTPIEEQQEHETGADITTAQARARSDSTVTTLSECKKTLVHAEKKSGLAITQASILYRYPPTVEPPPSEVCDFCIPLGGRLQRLSSKEEDSTVQEILFGHSHSKRSGRCFIFLLEDRSVVEDGADEEGGVDTGKLYGICVLHPRLLKTKVGSPIKRHHLAASNAKEEKGAAGRALPSGESENIEFESTVCYAFITRFPLFDFFFQVIFDLITTERLSRMEAAVDQSDSDLRYSRSAYQYLPQAALDDCLKRLTRVSPPKYGEKLSFSSSPSIQNVEAFRPVPQLDYPEHLANAAAWALPSLLSWMPLETLVWTLSLLLTEAKVVVVGFESGMVSCAVMGLLALLRPLDWVAPLIPMLPLKLVDFVESPTPILAGLTLDAADKDTHVEKLLNRCQ